ncbi:MAG TPA: polymer-forming cytoskeletal protein [Chthoniobacterales bacterium]
MADISSTKNSLSSDVEIKGSIRFTNDLSIDGKVEGEIFSEGTLTLGENADVRGEIKTKSVTVYGKVNGNITVVEKCELKARAQLIGDLKAARLIIEEGATFVGKSEVTPNKNLLPKNEPSHSLPPPAPTPKEPAFAGR